MAMITKSVKCINKKCKEVFHVPECRIAGGINDKCAITIRCDKCGKEMEIPVLNREYHWGGENYSVVSSRDIDSAEEWHRLLHEAAGRTAVVSSYEDINMPLHRWSLREGKSLWKDVNYDYELSASCALKSASTEVHNTLGSCQNACLANVAGYGWCRHMFVEQHYRIGRKKLCAIWAKDIEKCEDISTDNLYMIHHSRTNGLIDGIYSRDLSLLHLERLLVRWRMLCDRVVVATPFIGYDFKWSKEREKKELIGLWHLLNGLLDMDKTMFYTRDTTYYSLKKNQKELDIPADVLKEWDLMTNLQRIVDNPKTRGRMKEQFHLKVYAGIFSDRVELYSGSYNVQLNETLENMYLRNIPRDKFKQNYMDVMIDTFQYEEPQDMNVLHLIIDEDYTVKTKVCQLSEINNIITKIR